MRVNLVQCSASAKCEWLCHGGQWQWQADLQRVHPHHAVGEQPGQLAVVVDQAQRAPKSEVMAPPFLDCGLRLPLLSVLGDAHRLFVQRLAQFAARFTHVSPRLLQDSVHSACILLRLATRIIDQHAWPCVAQCFVELCIGVASVPAVDKQHRRRPKARLLE